MTLSAAIVSGGPCDFSGCLRQTVLLCVNLIFLHKGKRTFSRDVSLDEKNSQEEALFSPEVSVWGLESKIVGREGDQTVKVKNWLTLFLYHLS